MAKEKKSGSAWSKKLSGTQVFALAIVVVMVGSSIAFALLSGGDTSPTNTVPTQPLSDSAGTPLTYSAVVSAKIKNMAASFTIVSPTGEVDIGKIDSLVSSVSGVRQVSSRFRQVQDSELVYYADVSFDDKKTSFETLEKALIEKTRGIFLSPTFIRNGFVEIPKTVQLTNADLNLTKTQTFESQLVPGRLESLSQSGDVLSVQLQVVLAGSLLQSVQAFEIQNSNENTVTQNRLSTADVTVIATEPVLGLIGQADYAPDSNNDINPDFWQNKINAAANVSSGPVSISQSPVLGFTIKKIIALEPFLNFLSTLNTTNKTQAYTGQLPYQVTIEVNSKEDYFKIKKSVDDYLQSANVLPSDVSFLPMLEIQSQITVIPESANSSKVAADKIQIALKNDATSIKLFQLAQFSVGQLTDDTNATFTVPSGQIEGRIVPGTKIGDVISAIMQFSTRRNTMISVTGIQKELVDTPAN